MEYFLEILFIYTPYRPQCQKTEFLHMRFCVDRFLCLERQNALTAFFYIFFYVERILHALLPVIAVRACAQSQIRFVLPIRQIVSAFISRLREVGYFITPVAVFRQSFCQIVIHLFAVLFRRQEQFSFVVQPAENSSFFYLQTVN